jgi:hypothetical protein
MQVEPYDRCRFLVTVHGNTFLVDLLGYDGNGKCDCWPFIRKDGLRDEIEQLRDRNQFPDNDLV